MMSTRIPLLLGTGNMGDAGTNGARVYADRAQGFVDAFLAHGYHEIDTARIYCDGTTERLLSEIDFRDAVVDTKVYPLYPGAHEPSALRTTFVTSLQTLKMKKVRTLYLHAPDRATSFESTLSELNKLYNEGLFEQLGLSNFAAWEVAEIAGICKTKGYVQPRIYQAMYNAITRQIETELIDCLRKYEIRLVIYNPLAGGLFSGKVTSTDSVPAGGRFDDLGNNEALAKIYRARYLNDGYIEALKNLRDIADKHRLRLTEIALRWCQHHSKLTPDDGIILGASSIDQLEQNCLDSAKGPLPIEVVEALDGANRIVIAHGAATPYWR